ncbi:helix-turn-helix transcriptional regulator [Bacillaceae bacterium Marseille-Q3522]|nr:helix-turn-helix transcriptional regulator [Bacillaceae bacterium Marseille-Q3522]
MYKFINNLNLYINHYHLKHSLIAMRTGIEKNKLSRLLNGIQDILYEDMEAISKALGKEIDYFLQGNLNFLEKDYKDSTSISFYRGFPDEDKKRIS